MITLMISIRQSTRRRSPSSGASRTTASNTKTSTVRAKSKSRATAKDSSHTTTTTTTTLRKPTRSPSRSRSRSRSTSPVRVVSSRRQQQLSQQDTDTFATPIKSYNMSSEARQRSYASKRSTSPTIETGGLPTSDEDTVFSPMMNSAAAGVSSSSSRKSGKRSSGTLEFDASWIAHAHTIIVVFSFFVALVVACYLHYYKIIKNEVAGYPDVGRLIHYSLLAYNPSY